MITQGEILYSYFQDEDNINVENCLVKGTVVKRPSKHVKSPSKYPLPQNLPELIVCKDCVELYPICCVSEVLPKRTSKRSL